MTRRAASRTLGMAISLLCLGYFFTKAAAAWNDVHLQPTASIFITLGAALLPILVAYAALAMNWVILLRCVQIHIPASIGTGIYLAAQFAKYLPGNVAQYAGRVVLTKRRGYSTTSVALSMALELMLLLAFAAALSVPLADMVVHALRTAWSGSWLPRAFISLVIAVATIGATILFIMRRRSLLSGARRWVLNLRAHLRGKHLASKLFASACLAGAALSLCGFSLLILNSDSASGLQLKGALGVISLYSLAWLVGLLTPGAPAGLGVREAILTGGLTPLFGVNQAVSSALLFRLLTTVADLLAFGVGLLLLRHCSVEEITSDSDDLRRRKDAPPLEGKAPR